MTILMAAPAWADPPVAEHVEYANERFDVTLSQPDTGWDHYADGWRVELADGTVLGTRVLAHPHVTEQPFTRSSNIEVPEGVDVVSFAHHAMLTDGQKTRRPFATGRNKRD